MTDRFFHPDTLEIGDCVLTGPEAHHLAHVKRIKQGETVILFNGDGNEYLAEVISIGRRCVVVNVREKRAADRELRFPITVAAALPKADRTDFLIEKLTELGAACFVPLVTTRSVVVPRDGTAEKLQRAVIEASKQCGRNRLMRVEPPQRWEQFVRRPDLPPLRVVLDPGGAAVLPPIDATGGVVAVGPEGGFTPQELESARRYGWQMVSLGPRVLRIETAAIAAMARWSGLSEPITPSPSIPYSGGQGQ